MTWCGRRIGVDASTQEANAALRRRSVGTPARITGDAGAPGQGSGIETPSTEDLIRFDRTRKGKSLSNAEWSSPTDPEARIAKMKDGTTHLAYKPEHAVDLDTGGDHRREDPSGRPGRHPDPGGHAEAGRGDVGPRGPDADTRGSSGDGGRQGLPFPRGSERPGGQRLEEPDRRDGAQGVRPLARR